MRCCVLVKYNNLILRERAGLSPPLTQALALRRLRPSSPGYTATTLMARLSYSQGPSAVGRDAITDAAQAFMTAFPDLKVMMDGLEVRDDRAIFRWTLDGTNIGPGGTGAHVRISGHEEWRIGDDGLIAESLGHFDTADYQMQLERRVRDNR